MTRIKPSSYFVLVILLTAAVVMISALVMQRWQSKVFPLIIGAFIFVLGSVQLWKEICACSATAQTTVEREPHAGAPSRSVYVGLAWICAVALGCFVLGFIPAIALFAASFLRFRGRGWKVSVATAIITAGLVYLVFQVALEMDLYMGLLPERIAALFGE